MRIIDWLKSLYGPDGSQSHTMYFHGKPELTQAIINAVYANEMFLEPGVADDLIDFVKHQSGSVKTAMSFQKIVDYRMKDVDELFESFFEERGMLHDPAVHSFIENVKSDLMTAWEQEFPEADETPKPGQKRQVSTLPPSIPEVAPAPQAKPVTAPHPTNIRSNPVDIIDAVREAKDMMPAGIDHNQIANELLQLFLGKTGWSRKASQNEPEELYQARMAMEAFLDTKPNRQEWEPFAKHVLQILYNKWSPERDKMVGTLHGVAPSKAVAPLMRPPKTQTPPDAILPIPEKGNAHPLANQKPVNPASPEELQIRRKHYSEEDF